MQRACYSDIGFIVLGEVLARLAGEPLDRFCQREIFVPLRMNTARFCPPAEWKSEIPPTVDDREFRMRVIQGEVHDENASVMGGISGHAGLFANALDVALFAHAMLRGGARPIVSPETVRLFTTRQSRARRHLARARMGHALGALAIGQAFLRFFLRTSRLHRHLAVVRPRTPVRRGSAHQPHLARSPHPADQARAPARPRCHSRSAATRFMNHD